MENLKDVMEEITFVQGDICNREEVERAIIGCDAVVNFAAETHVDRSIIDAGTFDEIYGSIPEGSFSETDPLSPSSPYSASKAGADLLARAYHIIYNLPVVITRSSNNFGPYQYPEKLIPLFILKAMRGEKLPVYGTGLNVRDWLYVRDNCRGIALALHEGKAGEIYNIGEGNELTSLEITRRILQGLGKPESLIEHVTDRPGHDFRYSISSDKIRALGWKPEADFDRALD